MNRLKNINLRFLLMPFVLAFIFAFEDIDTKEKSSEELWVVNFLAEGVVLPPGQIDLPKITIDYTKTDHAKIAKNLLGADIEAEISVGLTRVIDQGFQTYATEDGRELLVFPHGGITFNHPFAGVHELSPLTRTQAESVLDIFNDNFNYFPEDASLVNTGEIKHPEYQSFNNSQGLPFGYIYEYGRYFKNILIKNDVVRALVVGGRVWEFSFSWGDQPVEIEDTEATIIPAWSAVKDAIEYAYRNFYAGEYYADVFVTKIQLVYTFDGLQEAWKKDEPKRLVPAWVVQINKSNEIILEAFTGQVIPIY